MTAKMTPTQISELSTKDLISRYGIKPTTLEDGTPAMQITSNVKEATAARTQIVARKAEVLAELAARVERRAAAVAQQLADATAWMQDHGYRVLERSGAYGIDLQMVTLVDMAENDLARYADWFINHHPLKHSMAPDSIALDCRKANRHPTLTTIMSRPADGVTTASEGHYWLLSDADVEAIRAAVAEVTQAAEAKARQAHRDAAQAIVDRVAAEGGPDKLMTAKEVAAWRRHYNDVANEGGDGYIPEKVSQETYARALEVLATTEA